MTMYPAGLPPSPSPSQPHGLETEHRLTKLETKAEDHGNRITVLERVLWGLIIAVYGMAHEKLPRILELLDTLAKLRP